MENQLNTKCAIWETKAVQIPSRSGGVRFSSPRAGGTYDIAETAQAMIENNNKYDDQFRIKLTDWIIDQHRHNTIPFITSNTLEKIKSYPSLSVKERSVRLLEFISDELSYIGEETPSVRNGESEYPMRLFAHSSSLKIEEIEFLVRMLNDAGYVKCDWSGMSMSTRLPRMSLSPYGYQYLDELRREITASTQVFVAMWFDNNMNVVYENGFEPAIREMGYQPLRIDNKEHNNKIDDEIVKEIRQSKFLVADFTSGRMMTEDAEEILVPRGGVYFEAGLAQGLGMPVIWTCREDCISDIHFDTRQYNHITWNTPEELKDKLINRIGATIGEGRNI